MNWINNLKNINEKIYSQKNQDGLIKNIFENIGITNKFCIEFGFNSYTLTGGSGSNVARLIIEDGWNCLLFDSFYENTFINLYKEFLTPDNISSIFHKYSVPKEFDYLSIDVDSIDLWLMDSILKNDYIPRLISIEYNANFPIDFSYTVNKDTTYIGDMIYGASLLALNKVANKYNYSLIAVAKHADLFFIKNDLLNIEPPHLETFKNMTGKPCHKNATYDRIKMLIEYPSMKQINDIIIKKYPNIFRLINN